MKVSNKAKRDYAYFLSYESPIKDFGSTGYAYNDGPDDPMLAWYKIDTLGYKEAACNDLPTLRHILEAKASLNLDIEHWSEDLASDMGILRQDEMKTMFADCPPWVVKAVFEQAAKLSRKIRGYVPRWIEYKEHDGKWETPWEESQRENPAEIFSAEVLKNTLTSFVNGADYGVKTIWTLSAVNDNIRNKTFGWEETQAAWFNKNLRDFEEARFTHVVLEEWESGKGFFANSEVWYAIREDGQWIEVEKPDWAEGIVNYAFSA